MAKGSVLLIPLVFAAVVNVAFARPHLQKHHAKHTKLPFISNLEETDGFEVVKEFIMQQIGVDSFDHAQMNVYLTELGILQEGEIPLALKLYQSELSATALTARYGNSISTFLDKIIELNRDSLAINSFLKALLAIYPDVSKWEENIESKFVPSTANCVRYSEISTVLREAIHLCVIYDGITRLGFNNPTTFLKTLRAHFKVLFKEIDLTGAATFWNVKFPSVVKPIKEFIMAAEKLQEMKQRELSKGGENLEEDEDDEHYKEMFILKAFDLFIKSDPTEALRTNIKEAAVAEIVVFKRTPEALVARDELPENSRAGIVLMSDAYFGAPQGCNEACKKAFPVGKFLFTNSNKWMHLYSAWNMAFTVSTGLIGDWWSKLLPPAVLEDKSGEEYIIRRAIALWLALHRYAFLLPNQVKTKCSRYDMRNTETFQHLFGSSVYDAAGDYASLWLKRGTECIDCYEKFVDEYKSLKRYDWFVSKAVSRRKLEKPSSKGTEE